MTTTYQKLKLLRACEESIEWAGDKSIEEIWSTCHRGDWMLWLFKKTNPNQIKELTRAKAYCALTVRHLMKAQKSIEACEVALKFADGLANNEELKTAAAYAAAYAAAEAATAAAADAAAAYAAAEAAYAADADAAAYAAAYAAAEAAYAADADADAAKIKNQKETADICRKYLPIPNF